MAVAWWSALADDFTVGAVQACCVCSLVSSLPIYKVPHCLLRASLQSFRPPTSPFGQHSQTETWFHRSTFGTQAFSVADPISGTHCLIHCMILPSRSKRDLKTRLFARHWDMSALEVSLFHGIMLYNWHLHTYLLPKQWIVWFWFGHNMK